jgi:hypothetical protein
MAPNTDIATRALIVSLKAGIIDKPASSIYISSLTGVPERTINQIYARAIARGFDPAIRPLVLENKHLEDAPRSGRPTKDTKEVEELITSKVRLDRYGREKTCAQLAGDLSQAGIQISGITIWRILRRMGFKKTKPTRKPGLTKRMREERLAWALAHEHWTLEDWKRVIFSDETSVVIGHRRGGYRVWRTKDEPFLKSCIRERWKGYSEFMFWGCFSYDQKGPCHIWQPETAAEKRQAEKKIAEFNKILEPIARTEWELNTGFNRLGLRNKPGPKPQWKWDLPHGKLARTSKKGGIDWWRYYDKILKEKLIPFAKKCIETQPRTIVQEDLAPSHAHHFQKYVYSIAEVERLTWCGNSPDLNAIEPCWFWMKRETTKKGAPSSKAAACEAWLTTWDDLPQAKIQAWIERIPNHIKHIIDCKGGNEYKEGRNHVKRHDVRITGATQ